jgi:hypothetical protein
MTDDFNKWWDEDVLTEDNPFNGGTPAYWAWEGWCAAVKAERNATLDEIADKIGKMPFGDTAASFAVWIREQKTCT